MSTSFDNIVVAIRTPDSDDALLAYAATIARLGKTKSVRVVHVANGEVNAARLREQMRARVAPAFADLNIQMGYDVLHGALTDRLLHYVTDVGADVVMLGSKKRRLGARLAMTGPCSVVIVPTNYSGGLSHIMFSLDFSEASRNMVRWGTKLAAVDRSIRCTALHVVTHESTDLFETGESTGEQAEKMRHLLAESNDEQVAIAVRLTEPTRGGGDLSLSHPFSMAASIEGADVAHTILSEAAAVGADCIALSTRGRSRSASILLGSVTEKVIERSTVPLLISKHSAHHLSLISILLGQGPDRRVKAS